MIGPHTERGLAHLREALIEEHRAVAGSDDGLLIGLQLTHSGRYSRPDAGHGAAPRILYRHPILDHRVGTACRISGADGCGDRRHHRGLPSRGANRGAPRFDFVDVKHCHGYLGHEFLSAHTREGQYGGSFENRTRFLRETVEGIRAAAPSLKIGVRLSAFDMVPFRPAPADSPLGAAVGEPEPFDRLIPYRWGFGVDPANPVQTNLTEPARLLALLERMDIRLVNLTAGSPYYTPHLQRPAAIRRRTGTVRPQIRWLKWRAR